MPEILEFFLGLSRSIIQGLSEAKKFESDVIAEGIVEGIKKSRKNLLFIGISIAFLASGFFLVFWGIAVYIDTFFAMKGAGYALVGIIAVLAGGLVAKS